MITANRILCNLVLIRGVAEEGGTLGVAFTNTTCLHWTTLYERSTSAQMERGKLGLTLQEKSENLVIKINPLRTKGSISLSLKISQPGDDQSYHEGHDK